jgi:hypothetical protein
MIRYVTKQLTLAGLIVVLGSAVGCARFVCQEVAESNATSPDGLMVATVVTRDCGATTDYSTSVNLHRSDHDFKDEAGDLFVATGRHQLAVKWSDADHLSIECTNCSRPQVSKGVSVLGKTTITYDIPGVIEASGACVGTR